MTRRISIVVKDAQPAKNNFCPYCKNENAPILTPIGSKKSFCGDCKKWFDAKLEDWHGWEAENIQELRTQYNDVMARINTKDRK
jgi:ribosomal protein L44E